VRYPLQAKQIAVVVLSLVYKPFTSLIGCSPDTWLCQRLAEEKQRQVSAHD